jgi:Uncharacterized protein conserved in bacteria
MQHRIALGALVAFAALTTATAASAHAIVSPAVALDKKLQQFTLSVPTEKAKLFTTEIELTLPRGFAIDSYEPSPGWTRAATSTTITWTGGHVPTEEDAVFSFNASTSGAKTYVFDVRQTYSDGSVVDWNGPESSDAPAPSIDALSSIGGGGTSTLTIVALALAGLALLVSLASLASRGGRSLT